MMQELAEDSEESKDSQENKQAALHEDQEEEVKQSNIEDNQMIRDDDYKKLELKLQ